ncbi:MAG: hypothetical protein J1G06_05795 [Oscillospiraceae bacterium]|nr:hypothetical protein [Oscillospiraceae bacterium]
MSYIRAEEILPEELIKLIQSYADGINIYIPRKNNNRKAWGENTTTRQDLSKRNSDIVTDFQDGISISELSKKYYLSEKSIQRIIYKKEN